VRDAEALAEAIKGLINNPSRCQSMGIAGRALAEREFDVQEIVAKHLRIYQELIRKS
jgi:glycosyltransferase involved in cell wall biosynthesis